MDTDVDCLWKHLYIARKCAACLSLHLGKMSEESILLILVWHHLSVHAKRKTKMVYTSLVSSLVVDGIKDTRVIHKKNIQIAMEI